MIRLSFHLDRRGIRRFLAATLLLCGVFAAGMLVFIYYWERLHTYGSLGQLLIRYWLVHLHLGTENVVAVWFSSMLLLTVGLTAGVCWAVEQREGRRGIDAAAGIGWMLLVAIFTLLSLDEIGSIHERVGQMTALNRVSLLPSETAPVGWVALLALPIAAVAVFILAFAWRRLRRVPGAFACVAAGIGLYLTNPLLEVVEGALVRGGGTTWLLLERVAEEGIAELGGTVCILAGLLLYLAGPKRAIDHEWDVPRARAGWVAASIGAALLAGVPVAHAVGIRLPAGDSGTPENWFPAAAFSLLAVFVLAARTSRARAAAAGFLLCSAFFGGSLYVYTPLYRALGYRTVLVDAIACAAALAAALVVVRNTRGSSRPTP